MATGHSTTRRVVVAGGAIAASLLSTRASIAGTDPALELVRRYRNGMGKFNAAPDFATAAEEASFIEASYGPPSREIQEGFPTPTTRAGALETARLLAYEQSNNLTDDGQVNMVQALVRYLEGA